MKIKLGARIIFGFGCTLLVVIALMIVSMYNMYLMHSKLQEVSLNAEKIKQVNILTQSMLKVRLDTRGTMIFQDTATLELENNEKAAARAAMDEARKSVHNLPLTEEEKANFQNLEDNITAARPFNTQVAELATAKKFTEAAALLADKSDPMSREGIALITRFVDVAEKRNAEVNRSAFQTYKNSFRLLLVLGIVFVLFAFGIAYVITRSITKPVNKIANSLNEGAGQVAAASSQLSATAGQLSQGSAEQASAIEETSSTLQETASMLEQNNANTKQAVQLSEQAKESADKGNSEMCEMMDSIQEIKRSSDQISKIIKVIDDIAFQTNILALNAAIEAARAGDAGAGFAVVAEEVRNLAQRSAQAAKDTTMIIEANIELSAKGVNIAEKVREALAEITTQARKVSELMGEISAASQEQTQGVDQVNKAMSQVETVTQQNAAHAEESASAAEELNAQADNMRKIVHELSMLVNGNAILKNQTDDSEHKDHSLTYQSGYVTSDKPRSNIALTDKADIKTKVISPEDVIPLEKDPHQF
jgi:methyl-accepting chemotaxis protein